MLAINPKIKQKAEDIRKKTFGAEVRESLASGLEAMSSDVVENEGRQSVVESRQDSVESQWQSVIDETTDKDVISAPEIIAARGNHDNLSQRLLSTDHQLAKNGEKFDSLKTANALHRLEITNYLGNSQSMHPSVLHFPNKWQGFEFWMAYTAYPDGNVAHENPSIAVSTNGVDWTIPNGLMNPIEPQPNTGAYTEYNSDTELLYRSDVDRLEIWYRYYNQTENRSIIYRRTSSNGVNWNPKEVMYDSRDTSADIVSPSIIVEDGKYKMWGVAITGVHTNHLVYTERPLSGNWIPISRCNVEWTGRPWHGSVVKTAKGYEHVMSVYPPGGGTRADLYYFYSVDNVTFSKPVKIMRVNDNASAFDSGTLYRSSILKIGGLYYLYYSARNEGKIWATSLATGTDITALNGYYDGRKLDLTRIKEIIFENVNSFVRQESIRLYRSPEREFMLSPDADKKNTMKVTNANLPDKPIGIRAGYVYLDKAQELTGLNLYEGAIRYNGTNQKHEGYNGTTWHTFDRFVNTAPSTYTSPGVKGDYAITSSHLYVCYSANLWARFPTETAWT